jgi:hypothetical protein
MGARTVLIELLSRPFGLAMAVQWPECAVVVAVHVEDVIPAPLSVSIPLNDDRKRRLEMEPLGSFP